MNFIFLCNRYCRLYLLNKNERLTQNATDPVTSIKLKEHLNTGDTGSCTGSSASCVEVGDCGVLNGEGLAHQCRERCRTSDRYNSFKYLLKYKHFISTRFKIQLPKTFRGKEV